MRPRIRAAAAVACSVASLVTSLASGPATHAATGPGGGGGSLGAGPARAARRVLAQATGLKVGAGLPISSTPGQGLWLVTRAGRVLA